MHYYLLADHIGFGPFQMHDAADWFRLVNTVMAILCVVYMLALPGATWRRKGRQAGPTTGRALAAAVAFFYAVGTNDHDADNVDGIRVYLITLALAMTLAALVIRNIRAVKSMKMLERAQ
jgi:hypothetical protein